MPASGKWSIFLENQVGIRYRLGAWWLTLQGHDPKLLIGVYALYAYTMRSLVPLVLI